MGRDSSIGGCSGHPLPALVKTEEPAGADYVPSLKLHLIEVLLVRWLHMV